MGDGRKMIFEEPQNKNEALHLILQLMGKYGLSLRDVGGARIENPEQTVAPKVAEEESPGNGQRSGRHRNDGAGPFAGQTERVWWEEFLCSQVWEVCHDSGGR